MRWTVELSRSFGDGSVALPGFLFLEVPGAFLKPGPYTAVCGHCNIDLRLHPVKHCPYEYFPVIHNGVTYGYRMIKKEKENGEAEEKKALRT